jgi:hypothetical protein
MFKTIRNGQRVVPIVEHVCLTVVQSYKGDITPIILFKHMIATHSKDGKWSNKNSNENGGRFRVGARRIMKRCITHNIEWVRR